MVPLELHPEIWSTIIGFLARPKPKIQTEEWKDLHQHDLTTMMRVSKMFNERTAPILYREPIVADFWSFVEPAGDAVHLRDLEGHTHDTLSSSILRISKAGCLRYTQKLHLIRPAKSYSFSYSNLFNISSLEKFEDLLQFTWDVVVLLDNGNPSSPSGSMMKQLLSVPKIGLGLLAHFYNLNKTLLGGSLRPIAITFSAWGETSWDNTQSSLRILPDMLPPKEKMYPAQINTEFDAFSSTLRRIVGSLQPKIHCTHNVGGPFGSNGFPFLDWGNHRPDITITHNYRGDLNFGITWGGRNIVIYHDWSRIEPFEYRQVNARMSIIERWEENLKTWRSEFTENTESHGDPMNTEVEMYGLPWKDGTMYNPELAQKNLDEHQLSVLKGKIKVYPYDKAPECTACGWRRDQ